MKKFVNVLLAILLLLLPLNLKANTILSRGERSTSLDIIKHKNMDAIVLEEGEVTITFDDGVTQKVEIVTPNSFLTPPESPSKTGYTFKGWYTARSGGNRWNFSVDVMPNINLVLYAQYTINWYALTYVDDDGKYETALSAMYGSLLSNQIKPARKDAVFLGWYDAPTGGNLWDFSIDRMPAKDFKLYARYATSEYTLTYNNDGVLTTDLVSENSLLIEPIKPIKDGYTFVGWFTETVSGMMWDFSINTMPTGNLVLYARYTLNSYDVSYINDKQDIPNIESVPFGALLSEPLPLIKEGYTFKGWYTAETDGIKWDFSTDTMPAHHLVLYAQYAINSYRVTFDDEGKQNEQIVTFNQKLTAPENPHKNGYTFIGWYTMINDGEKWDFSINTMPAGNLVLYARYTINSYPISYYDEALIHTDLIVYDSLLVEPSPPQKDGASFIGWFTSINGGNKWNFTTDRMPAHELKLYAQYTSNLYVVTYDNQGEISKQTVKKGTLLNEPTNPEKIGYAFKGWYNAKFGGQRWDFTTDLMPAQDLILYAQYVAENQIIVFDIAGGDVESKPDDIIQPTDSSVDISKVNNPTRKNYKFVGWYNGEVQVFGIINMPAGGMMLVAKWEETFKHTKPYIEAKNIEMTLLEVNYLIEQGNIHDEVLLRSEAVIQNNDSAMNYKFLYVELSSLTSKTKNELTTLTNHVSQNQVTILTSGLLPNIDKRKFD